MVKLPQSIVRHGKVWDIVVSRGDYVSGLVPVHLRNKDCSVLLCQVQNTGRFGWTVVVAGLTAGPRLVNGFKHRWQAIEYAISIRFDLLEDEGQSAEEQAQGDEVDSGRGKAKGSEPKADGGENPEQKVHRESHAGEPTHDWICPHGVLWKGMTYSHFAMQHKVDHP